MSNLSAAVVARLSAAARRVVSGDRAALARAITLVESQRADHRAQAQALMREIATLRAGCDRAAPLRLGVAGPPGAGKSTLIERLGTLLVTEHAQRVAVMAVDPSSERSGGSILGDKTRMHALAASPRAFVRPSPARGELGGLARYTFDCLALLDASGFDVCVIETVGVGQSELAIDRVCDLVLLVLPPAGGDALQGAKKGIVEIADVVAVNKADGELEPAARLTAVEYASELSLARRKHAFWKPPVLTISALDGAGIDELWQKIVAFRALASDGDGARGGGAVVSSWMARRQRAQAEYWLWAEVRQQAAERVRAHPRVRARLGEVEAALVARRTTPAEAARALIAELLPESEPATEPAAEGAGSLGGT